ncbi:MAG: fibronectin-binding domain-containing protein [Nitrospirae bacterium]|nr:fibronectin-binding domain-containing protein [Nitrospirota bacterium]
MDYQLLSQVADELADVLPGAKVDKVVQGSDNSLLLVLHQAKKPYYLLLSPDRSLPRMHLISRKPAGTGSPAGFFLSLRKHLTGSRVQGIHILDRDRVVELQFTGPHGLSLLIFELTGSVTNLLLTDASRTILSVLRPVSPEDRIRRPLLPGLTYLPPEKRPSTATATRGCVTVAPLEGYDGIAPVNRAVEEWYERTIAEREASSLRQQLVSAINKATARAERRQEAVSGDVAGAERGDEYRLAGDLLLANKHRITKGQERTELPGYDGALVSIPLDPARTPAENANRYFQRYKKAKAGLAMMRERLVEARDEIAFLRTVREDLEAVDDREGLLAVRSLLAKRGYVRDAAGKSAGKRAAASPPFRTIEHEGWHILVGKSAAGNDYITMRLARPDDLWLHAEGIPGSHVVVRNPGVRDIPEGIIRKAASLAAYYSKGKSSAKVPVAYTRAALVKKPKGAAQGTVVLTGRRTIMAVPELD